MQSDLAPAVVVLEAHQTYTLCGCCRCPNPQQAEPECRAPHPVQIERKQLLWICRCGLSQQRPFCDGRHNPRDGMTVGEALQGMWQDAKALFARWRR